MAKKSFEDQYPNIARWVYEHEGRIEIGYDSDSPLTSFVRAIDMGGTLWEGKDEYESLDDALLDLDAGVQNCLKEIYGE
jgi:hypothetical protein